MGIGALTLSLAPNQKKAIANKHNISSGDLINTTTSYANESTILSSITLIPTQPLQPTATPSPTPLTIYPLEKVSDPEIKTLIKDYYEAKLNCDLKALQNIFSDKKNIETKKQLEEDVLYVEDYQAIKSYSKKSYVDGEFIVYAYYEIKFLNIKTPAPAVKRFYIVTNEVGEKKIFSGVFDNITSAYYYDRDNDADVKKLIKATNKKGEKAKKSDEFLKVFWDKLNEYNKTTTKP